MRPREAHAIRCACTTEAGCLDTLLPCTDRIPAVDRDCQWSDDEGGCFCCGLTLFVVHTLHPPDHYCCLARLFDQRSNNNTHHRNGQQLSQQLAILIVVHQHQNPHDTPCCWWTRYVVLTDLNLTACTTHSTAPGHLISSSSTGTLGTTSKSSSQPATSPTCSFTDHLARAKRRSCTASSENSLVPASKRCI